ncbi:MAG TPA: DUF6252 family protein [Cryomorphaceae bacterium]|nr:DUF6252 family protein [Cryomorphaceae bacterium]
MKQTLLQAILLISVLLLSASCSEEEETPVFPTPNYLISGQTIDPVTGATSLWATNSVVAEFDAEGLRIKAINGSDTLFIAVAGVDSGEYFIDQESELANLNRYETLGENGLTLYTFQANGNGGGMFNITANDTINKTISGDFSVKYFNPINNSDFFELNNAQFQNLNYGSFIGPPVSAPGTGTISFTQGGVDYLFEGEDATAYIDVGPVIRMQGVTQPSPPETSISIAFETDITVGSYILDGTTPLTAGVVKNLTEVFLADSGSLEILMHDTINNDISGTFNFKGFSSLTSSDSTYVTDGVFNINYLE